MGHLGGSSPGVVAGWKIALATGCPGRSGEVVASGQQWSRAFFQKCRFFALDGGGEPANSPGAKPEALAVPGDGEDVVGRGREQPA